MQEIEELRIVGQIASVELSAGVLTIAIGEEPLRFRVSPERTPKPQPAPRSVRREATPAPKPSDAQSAAP